MFLSSFLQLFIFIFLLLMLWFLSMLFLMLLSVLSGRMHINFVFLKFVFSANLAKILFIASTRHWRLSMLLLVIRMS